VNVIRFFLLAALSLFWTGAALAQCQAGMPSAGNPQCIPPSAWPQNRPGQQAAPAEPVWKLTWGAISIDPNSGSVGHAVGSSSKRKAEREALRSCTTNGGGDCKKILFAYHNQCGVVAWPKVPGPNGQGGIIAQGGPTIEVASEAALKRCADGGSGDVCEIVYSECSKPILVR
jgi:hypothetical protein